jgi:hypothetical protein
MARGVAGVLVGLVAAALVSPAPVKAGCTSPHLVRSSGSHSAFALLAESGALAPLETGLPSPAKPCSGPACKQGAPRPFSSAPSITRVGIEEWALTATSWIDAISGSLDEPPMPVSVDGVDAAFSIFHPPRASSLVSSS